MKRSTQCLLVGLLSLGTARIASARDYEAEIVIDSLEDLYEMEANGDLESDSVRILEALFQRPMNINRADRWYLYDLPAVTYELADAIIALRDEKAGFEAIADLTEVPGMTPRTMSAMLPFISVFDAGDSPLGIPYGISATTKIGSILRRGFGLDPDTISEFVRGPEAYLRFTGTGLSYLGAGGLLTWRLRTDAFWDRSRGQLVTERPEARPDLASLYVFGGYGAFNAILGSYIVGFGESLVFDSTTETNPNGWRENNRVDEDNESGRIDPDNGQFGAAVSVVGADMLDGWVDATVFTSYDQEDLYQYEFNYGFDEFYGGNTCQTDGQCPLGYTCGDDNRCRSSRIIDADDPRLRYRYFTHADAFTEQMLGGNLTFNFDERSRIGVTGYNSWIDFNLASEADPKFAYSARYPRQRSFGAFGVNGRWGLGPIDFSGEYANTGGDGHGAFARILFEPTGWIELQLAARYYESDFENPHGRGEAARDELHGLSARNERGLKLKATVKPASRLRLVTHLDMWDNPDLPEFQPNGELIFRTKSTIPIDVLVAQRIEYGITSREDVALVLDYRNKDIDNNSRDEVYDRGDFCDESLSASGCGRGERRKVQLKLSTERLPGTYIWASYTAAWEDVSRRDSNGDDMFADKFDLFQKVRVHVRVNSWPGGRVVGHIGFWIHQKDAIVRDDIRLPISDREEPMVDGYLEIRQKLLDDRLTFWARYGLLHFKDETEERFAWYHLAKLAIEAKF